MDKESIKIVCVLNLLCIIIVLFIFCDIKSGANGIYQVVPETKVYESEVLESQSKAEIVILIPDSIFDVLKILYEIGMESPDNYLLAKIAMAEAETYSIKTKALVIMCVLNRVEYEEEFPNTISEVIFEKSKNTYQFSPTRPNGRFWYVVPDKSCYEALKLAKDGIYDSEGCLYFEDCSNPNNWHSRNLEYLYQSDGMRFYK